MLQVAAIVSRIICSGLELVIIILSVMHIVFVACKAHISSRKGGRTPALQRCACMLKDHIGGKSHLGRLHQLFIRLQVSNASFFNK